jgi:hypothetical protein
MIKECMIFRRASTAGFLLCLSLFGCAKHADSTKLPGGEISDIAAKTDVNGSCDSGTVSILLTGITNDETAKDTLDRAAKAKPAKENFRKLFDAEVTYEASSRAALIRLTACGAAAATLSDLEARVAKSHGNVAYLRESFPDFK